MIFILKTGLVCVPCSRRVYYEESAQAAESLKPFFRFGPIELA